MLLGTRAYQRYFRGQFARGSCYVSVYVQMEIKRSYLRNIISFYSVLEMSGIETVDDAFAFWSNTYKTSASKAVHHLVAQALRTQELDFKHPQDKPKALLALGIIIKRFHNKLRRAFKDTGQDRTHCARAAVPLRAELVSMTQGFKRYAVAFDDVKTCRDKCTIHKALLDHYRADVEGYVRAANSLLADANAEGFRKIASALKEVLDQGPSACSCHRCERIGDAVIALDSPRDMQLEHTDRSFNYLCPPINQPHFQHPSEQAVITAKV